MDELEVRPRRRREDEEVEQVRELIRTQTDVVTDLARRLQRAERILDSITDVAFYDMDAEQKRAFKPMAVDYVRRRAEGKEGAERSENWARWATIFSGITATILAVYAILGIIDHSLPALPHP